LPLQLGRDEFLEPRRRRFQRRPIVKRALDLLRRRHLIKRTRKEKVRGKVSAKEREREKRKRGIWRVRESGKERERERRVGERERAGKRESGREERVERGREKKYRGCRPARSLAVAAGCERRAACGRRSTLDCNAPLADRLQIARAFALS
jgi:hypothetical protein